MFLLLSTGGIVYTRFATPHYFAFLVPAAALAAGTTLARLQDDVAAAKGEAAGRVVVVIGVLSCGGCFRPTAPFFVILVSPATDVASTEESIDTLQRRPELPRDPRGDAS